MSWLEDYEAFRTSGKLPDGSNLMSLLDRRLAWEIWSEYTFDCRIGRTLEKTGSSTLEVKPDLWQQASRPCCRGCRNRSARCGIWTEASLARFLAGLVQNLKNRGAVDEADLAPYIEILGNTLAARQAERHAHCGGQISRAHRGLPVFLTSRGGERFQTLIRQPNNPTPTWYEDWLREVLLRARSDGCQTATREIYRSGIERAQGDGARSLSAMRGARVSGGLRRPRFEVTDDVGPIPVRVLQLTQFRWGRRWPQRFEGDRACDMAATGTSNASRRRGRLLPAPLRNPAT